MTATTAYSSSAVQVAEKEIIVNTRAHIGVTGLAVMGRNLARNFARHGYTVAVHNRTPSRTKALMEEFGHEGTFVPAETARDFVDALQRPRRLMIMVQAGAATDAVIDQFAPLLESGDMIIDGGNAHFADTRRREADLRERGIHFVGAGVSGGEEGALNGPSIMVGGSKEAYAVLGPMFETISAHVGGEACSTHIGSDGAYHFVKMVHNGIEYADMQLIAEAYDLLRQVAQYSPAEIAGIFRTWDKGRLKSYLIEITAEVLSHTDADTGRPFVDVVADAAGQKGTGRWTVQTALDLASPVTTIAQATFARAASGQSALRTAYRPLPGGMHIPKSRSEAERFTSQVEQALYASKVIAYDQGFTMIQDAALAYGWDIDFAAVAADLARRLHHPRRFPRPYPHGAQGRPRPCQPAGRARVRGGDHRSPGSLARGRRHRCPTWGPRSRVRRGTVVLRHTAGRPATGRVAAGPAGLLRRSHLPAYRPAGRLPHALGASRPS